jgi:ribosomal protein S18 acetylase RimI-like enzyme
VKIDILEHGAERLAEYAAVSIAFRVSEVLDLDAIALDPSAMPIPTRPVAAPYIKDYDTVPGDAPLDWPARFDVSRWMFLAALVDGNRVGCAAVIARDPAVDLLDGRDDLARLWDLRVAPEFRRRGVASALLTAAEGWAGAQGIRTLMVETQDVNVPACRFYARQGFMLGAVNHGAYPDLPHEVQLLWYRDRSAGQLAGRAYSRI